MLDLPRQPSQSRAPEPPPALGARARRAPRAARTCLLVPAHPERALSLALVRHFALELRGLELVLASAHPDVVWVCGYERGHASRIREYRRRYPHAALVVTAKGPEELWSEQVLAAGADAALEWPADSALLARVLKSSLQRRA
jgi:DNA-binding NarL/FixJ family response regulator